MLVQVKDTSFVRDTKSMALINQDEAARQEYYMRTKLAKVQKDEINSMKEDISSLKVDIGEIKDILRQLLGKGTNG
jgi:gluconate kinase